MINATMPNWIAITWETDRLLFLSANVHNGSATFEHAATLSEPKQLAEFVQKHHLAKAETVVVLSRADVEVRSMLFPPVPVDELPDLVRFQASKEFNGYDPNAPLDFFITNKLDNVSRSTLFPAIKSRGQTEKNVEKKTESPTGSPKHLLASILRADTFQKIQEFCTKQNLTLRHILLRPCEAVSLWKRSAEFDPNRSILFVELDTKETSQTVVFQGEPVFMRSPRISCPEDVSSSDFAARLVAELKRTRIAVRNEIQGVSVDDVVLCGVGEKFESLAKQLADGLKMPVKTFNPWIGIAQSATLKEESVNERYAPLLGGILEVAKGKMSSLDFCNPKKRREPAGHRQLMTTILAMVMFFVVGLLGYGFYSKMTLEDDVRKLTREFNELKNTAGTIVEQRVQLNAIDAWLADNVDWFAQLDWLSRNAPDAQDMMVSELMFNANNGGVMTLKSQLRDSSVASPMEEHFRDANHVIKTGERGEAKDNPRYRFRYSFSILMSSSGEEKTDKPDTEPTK
ncbi:hypothetical protein FACS1894189_0340 [Planctomycetales bacterium]|nr:hypothetical protein FACS1894189_0340 [Planctomycetales bacterium]